jgi:hypothetical protein
MRLDLSLFILSSDENMQSSFDISVEIDDASDQTAVQVINAKMY